MCLSAVMLALCVFPAAVEPGSTEEVEKQLAGAEQVNPFPRGVAGKAIIAQWKFENDAHGWAARHACELVPGKKSLLVRCTAHDPYFGRKIDLPGGRMRLELRARAAGSGAGSVFWTTDRSPQHDAEKMTSFRLIHDSQWRDYAVEFDVDGKLVDLRIDPGGDAGEFEIETMRLLRIRLQPLSIGNVVIGKDAVVAQVHNHHTGPIRVTAGGRASVIQPNETFELREPLDRSKPLQTVLLSAAAASFPPIRRTVFVAHPETNADWMLLKSDTAEGQLAVRIAADGSIATIERGNDLLAVLAPIVHVGGKVPEFAARQDPRGVHLDGKLVDVQIALSENLLIIDVRGGVDCEGPVVRALGQMQRGLFAGIEDLEAGETSSSRLDIETPEHLRFAPDPLQVTMPLMAIVGDRGSVAMTWRKAPAKEPKTAAPPTAFPLSSVDMAIQPVFAAPNFFDGAADHRLALRGRDMRAIIWLGDQTIEESIVWAVQTMGGLPAPPTPPRTVKQQRALCLTGLSAPLRTDEGWGHCVEEKFKRQPYADMASTWWRLAGEIPAFPKWVPGGAHVTNDAIYFVSGRAQEWLELRRRRAEQLMKSQGPDGSYRYSGEYARGHFEDTSIGTCARPATELLEFARLTGDEAALQAGLKTLDYMRRFNVPRGAQTWEIPLHTPDQLASAYAVWAYVRGYELTGNRQYLDEARRWAISGVPFTYLWARYPVMLYGTVPVLGATNWKAPNWIGLPVQWVGGVYAYALTRLAPHDKTLDWSRLARGILVAAQQMQYPDGELAGLLPDSFALADQERRPWNINPSALVSLEFALDGQLDSLAVAQHGDRRVVAPFPVAIESGKAIVTAQRGVKYQVLVDGQRVVDVESAGRDEIPLNAGES
ncbi:MAG: hypothetical protein ACOY3P_07275 [Planctomycetota bacterium]